MLERKFQTQLIDELERLFPGCLILKNDEQWLQGIPDLTVLWRGNWAFLEGKRSAKAPARPNQAYYIEMAQKMSFGAFIYPENMEAVLDDLQCAFAPRRPTRISLPKQSPLG